MLAHEGSLWVYLQGYPRTIPTAMFAFFELGDSWDCPKAGRLEKLFFHLRLYQIEYLVLLGQLLEK
ncbi:hypothetical protein BSK47_08750 [Paenibacillus odorifer]|uniref:Uncharacterized protein n=1 Tax=Paenibacillus odorifer TaxID=189426 RepID=A0AB36JHY6_9BACL|nr:hypothetical protein BSK47_08750 [Paenibacillus odorifer]